MRGFDGVICTIVERKSAIRSQPDACRHANLRTKTRKGIVVKLSKGVIIAIIAMVTVGLWFIIDHFAPGSPSWVVYIFGAAAIIGVAAWGNKGGSN